MSKQIYAVRDNCRACGNTKLVPILNLGEQALTGRFPGPNEPDPPAGPLELVMCDTNASPEACGLVQLAHTCDLTLMYGPSYGYRSSITQTMVSHLHASADEVLGRAGAQSGDAVLEVGANDGTIQRHISGRGLKLVAIDPSAGKFAESYPPDSKLIVDFFSASAVRAKNPDQTFKTIISLAMFYDIEQPLAFMREIRDLLHTEGLWLFEQAYLPSMFTSLCYDSVCHEHLCCYGLRQVEWLAKRAGLRIVDVELNDVNGGSFRVFACRDDAPYPVNTNALNSILSAEDALHLDQVETWRIFAERVESHARLVRTFFETARENGQLVLGLGASTKGSVVLQYVNVDASLMPAIAERDPFKVGLRTPRTNIPLIAESQARGMNPHYFFVGPWHFRDEIIARERAFLDAGGALVFPLPTFEIVRASDT